MKATKIIMPKERKPGESDWERFYGKTRDEYMEGDEETEEVEEDIPKRPWDY